MLYNKMDIKMEFPKIPELKGEENLQEWRQILRQTLRVHRLLAFIDPGVPEPENPVERETWDTERAQIILMMLGSFNHVQQKLLNYGWDPDEQNPKVVYDLVLKAIPDLSQNGCPFHQACGGGDSKYFELHSELCTIQKKNGEENNPDNTSIREPLTTGSQRVFQLQSGLSGEHIQRGLLDFRTNRNTQPISFNDTPRKGQSKEFFTALENRELTRHSIIYDSGASTHTFNDLKWFSEIALLPDRMDFLSANRGDHTVEYVGIAHYEAYRSDGGITKMDLQADYCPQAPCNMMSAAQLRKDGAVFDGFTDRLKMKHSGIEAAQLQWIDNVLVFKTVQQKAHQITKIFPGKLATNNISNDNYETGGQNHDENYDYEAVRGDPTVSDNSEAIITGTNKSVAVCDIENETPIPECEKKKQSMDTENKLEVWMSDIIKPDDQHGYEYLTRSQKPGPGVAIPRQTPSETTSRPGSIAPKQKPVAMAPFGAATPKTCLNIAIAPSGAATVTTAPKVIQRAAAGAAVVKERPKLQAASEAKTEKSSCDTGSRHEIKNHEAAKQRAAPKVAVPSHEGAAAETYPNETMAPQESVILKPLYPDLRPHGYPEKQPGKPPQISLHRESESRMGRAGRNDQRNHGRIDEPRSFRIPSPLSRIDNSFLAPSSSSRIDNSFR